MNSLFASQRPSRSDLRLVAAYWLVVAPVLLLQYRADTGWSAGRVLPVVGATVLFDTATVALLVGGLLPLFLRGRHWLGLALLLPFLLLSGSAYLGLYGGLLGHPINLAGARVVLGAVQHAKSYGLLAVLLTGKRYFEAQRHVLLLQKAQAESALRNLKAQLDPHFLFNNLNVLRGLIQEDPAAANEFVTRLAALYRFLIRHQHEDVVPLAEELQFADEYVYLLRHRFGNAYEFRQTLPPAAVVAELLLVPGTIQLLLENAIKHNAGNEDAPLLINLEATATALTVCHARRPKRTPVESAGTGLANLRERYRLLFQQEIRVEALADSFTVTIPLLRQTRRAAVAQPLVSA
ncbi:sensor histidine kinase [Hymenobacter glaciei]